MINFQSLNRHSSVLLDQILLQLDRKGNRKGIIERENGEMGGGGGGRLLEEGDYFKYFPSKGGDYSREAINRTAIIRENTLLE